MRLRLSLSLSLLAACGGTEPTLETEHDASAPTDAANPDGGGANPLQDLCDEVEAELAATAAPGWGIAIVEDGEIAVIKAGGVADVESGAPVTLDTPFRTLALSELYTSIATLEAAAAGLIDLDAPVRDYLPTFEIAPAAWRDQITVRHLLHQTGGLPSRVRPFAQGFGENIEACDMAGDLGIDAWVAELAGMEMGAPPGRFQIRDIVSPVVLAQLLETVEGRPFADVIDDRVFAPAGMSGARVGWVGDAGIARGHEGFGITVVPAEPDGLCEAHQPLHLAYASIGDLARLAQILASDGLGPGGARVFAAPTIDAVLDGTSVPSWVASDMRAGTGLHPWPDPGGTVSAILSVGFGYGVGLAVSRERRFGTVVVRNESNSPWQEAIALILEARLGATIINRQYTPDPATWDPDPETTLAAIAGEYQNVAGDLLTVTYETGTLRGTAPIAGMSVSGTLRPMLPDRFNASTGAGASVVRLFRDAAGGPEAIWVQYADHPFFRLPAGPPTAGGT